MKWLALVLVFFCVLQLCWFFIGTNRSASDVNLSAAVDGMRKIKDAEYRYLESGATVIDGVPQFGTFGQLIRPDGDRPPFLEGFDQSGRRQSFQFVVTVKYGAQPGFTCVANPIDKELSGNRLTMDESGFISHVENGDP